MKTNIQFILISIAFIATSCTSQNDEKDYELDMSNVKKKTTVMVYQAVVNGDDVSKGEITDYIMKDVDNIYNSYSTLYYDANNHRIYESYCSITNKTNPYRTVKTNWYSNNPSKWQSIYERRYDDGDNKYKCDFYKKTVYDRNSDGKLMRIMEYSKSDNYKKYDSDTLSTFQYDSYGNKIEEIKYGNEYSKTVYSQYNNEGQFQQKRVYDLDNQLIEELTGEYYPNGKLVKTEYDKTYKYNQLVSDIQDDYTYDDKGRMIEKIETGLDFSGTGGTGFVSFPSNLSEQETEKYIKENYYGKNLKLKSVNMKWNFFYDDHNREVSRCFYNQDDENNSLTQPGGMFYTPPCGRVATYKDNEKGDWIEMIMYNNDKPSYIVTREIEYF